MIAIGGVAGAIAHAVLDAVIAGIVIAVLEVTAIAARAPLGGGDLAALALIVTGLSVGLATIAGAPLVVGVRILARHPALVSCSAGIRGGGPGRVATLTALGVAAGAAAMVWLIGYRTVYFVHRTYQQSGAASVLAATVIVVVAIAALTLASALAPPLGRLLAERRLWVAATRGMTGAVVLAILVVTVAGASHVALRRIAPAWDPIPAYVAGAAVVLLVLAAIFRPARWIAGRGRRWVAFAMAVPAVVLPAAFATLGELASARAAVMSRGVVSAAALRRLYRLDDGDGDGYADRFGGTDCDDSARAVHPRALEIPGNDRDDNCQGGDAAAGAVLQHRSARPSRDPASPRHDIVLITIDAVRADHTSLLGYARPTTPVLDQIARHGARFAHAMTPAPYTRRALPALLFGRYATTLPFVPGGGMPRLEPNQLPTLASTLASAGYTTHAVISSSGIVTDEIMGGFASVDTVAIRRPGEHQPDNAVQVTDHAITWIRSIPAPSGAERPYFLWIHYIDPHNRYVRPAGAPDFGDGDRDRYDSEIAHVDAQVGRLITAIGERGPVDRTIVAVTSDHGEAFGEHGAHYHGTNLYQEQTHVPLLIAPPAGSARHISGPVSLVDVAPTLLDLVGVDAPAGMNGLSLVAAIRDGTPVPDRPILSELVRDKIASRNMVAVYRGDWKLIRDLEIGTIEVYDLGQDRGEHVDRRDTARAAELARDLATAVDLELSVVPGSEGQAPPAPK